MPIKFSKEVSTNLFKYLRTIDIQFNPFDVRNRSARELLRQVQAGRITKANPKLKIGIEVHSRPDAPLARFCFVDGSEENFETYQVEAKDMLHQIFLKASRMDPEYEMEGKSLDDA